MEDAARPLDRDETRALIEMAEGIRAEEGRSYAFVEGLHPRQPGGATGGGRFKAKNAAAKKKPDGKTIRWGGKERDKASLLARLRETGVPVEAWAWRNKASARKLGITVPAKEPTSSLRRLQAVVRKAAKRSESTSLAKRGLPGGLRAMTEAELGELGREFEYNPNQARAAKGTVGAGRWIALLGRANRAKNAPGRDSIGVHDAQSKETADQLVARGDLKRVNPSEVEITPKGKETLAKLRGEVDSGARAARGEPAPGSSASPEIEANRRLGSTSGKAEPRASGATFREERRAQAAILKWGRPTRKPGGMVVHRSGDYSIETSKKPGFRGGDAFRVPADVALFRGKKMLGRFSDVEHAKAAAGRDAASDPLSGGGPSQGSSGSTGGLPEIPADINKRSYKERSDLIDALAAKAKIGTDGTVTLGDEVIGTVTRGETRSAQMSGRIKVGDRVYKGWVVRAKKRTARGSTYRSVTPERTKAAALRDLVSFHAGISTMT